MSTAKEPSRFSTHKPALAWACYDWANTGYAMVVLALIFPPLYNTYWGSHLAVDRQTFYFNITLAVASIVVAILAPFLANLAAVGGGRKKYLFRFAWMGMIASALLYAVGEGHNGWASMIYVVGTVSFYCGNIFFDSMLADVSTDKNRNFISGLGFSFAYTSGLLLVLLSILLKTYHTHLGIETLVDADRLLFIVAAVWWCLFSLPLYFSAKDSPQKSEHTITEMIRLSFAGIKTTFLEMVKIKTIFWFLLAYLFYIDGVNTIIMSAANYGSTIGFTEMEINTGFLFVQIVGVPCALLFGFLADRTGPRPMIFCAIFIYIGISFYAAFIDAHPVAFAGFSIPKMYVLAILIGVVQGGIQALSRSYFVSIIPQDKAIAYFGFYSMIGKSAAVLGPLLMALVAILFNRESDPVFSTRCGYGSLTLLFVLALVFFTKSKPVKSPSQ